jgi:adenosylhomocysteine nucleosidase
LWVLDVICQNSRFPHKPQYGNEGNMNNHHSPHPVLTILTALGAERKILAGKGSAERKEIEIIQCGLGCPAVLKAAAQIKASTIIGNIGVSGGLSPDFVPGTVILADTIINRCTQPASLHAMYRPDADILGLLESTMKGQGIECRRGSLLCASQPLLSAQDKAAAYLKTGAIAVDMESAAAAEAARRFGVPFFCLRVVSDPADRTLHRQLLAGVDARGNSRPLRLLGVLCRHPSLVKGLFTMAGDFSRAASGIRQAWNVIRRPLIDLAAEHR